MPLLKLRDGAELFYKDWGHPSDPILVFSHGWPVSSDSWDAQMLFFASRGFRCIAHDRRGHGRSTQTWTNNHLDAFADDLYELFKHLNVKHAVMIGHSHGGAEVVHFLGRHGSSRVRKAVLIGAVAPLLRKTEANAEGVDQAVLDGFRTAILQDRAQFFLNVASGPFFNYDRPGAVASEGQIRNWWRQSMNTSAKTAYDCVKDFSETDLTGDLQRIQVPVLLLHGDADQIVPLAATSAKAVQLLAHATLKVYPGGSHAIHNLSADKVNQDILEFTNLP